MTAFATLLLLALTAVQTEPQDKPRVPEDSVELTVVGCLKGRAFSTVPQREADVQRGPNVGQRTFRLAGKREVMDEVKKLDRRLVEVIGIVKRSSLDDKGVRVGGVAISGGSPVARSGSGVPNGAENVAVMDVTSVRQRAASCNVVRGVAADAMPLHELIAGQATLLVDDGLGRQSERPLRGAGRHRRDGSGDER